MKTIETRVAIVGGGTAGMNAFREARKLTDRVLLIENHHFGTTCVREGCMPSKLLIAAAHARRDALRADPFGVRLDRSSVKVDGPAVMSRVQKERDRFLGFVMSDVEGFPAENKLLGKAEFVSANELVVDGETKVKFESAVIATGSAPFLPPKSGLEGLGDRLLTNENVFDLPDVPKSVAVWGAGVIGMELAGAFANLGARVTVSDMTDSICAISDPDIAQDAREIFSRRLDLRLKTKATAKLGGDGVILSFEGPDGKKSEETYEYLLVATGRRPNFQGLGLGKLDGLKLDGRGVPVSGRFDMATSLPNIFIAGDASNQSPLLHEASDQGKIAGKNAALFPKAPEKGLRRSHIGVVFSDPQIMSAGEKRIDLERRVRSFDDEIAVGRVSFSNQGRSRVMLVNEGSLSVYADKKTGRFLGAEMIGPAAEHIAHLLAWAHQMGLTAPQMLEMPFYHPVIEEGVRTALRDAAAKLA